MSNTNKRYPYLDNPKLMSYAENKDTTPEAMRQELYRFFNDLSRLQFYPPAAYRLQGNITGHPSFSDGTGLMTSDVLVIEKVINGTDLPDLLCAITKSGGRYFFRANALSVRSF